MEFFRFRRDIPFMRHALVFNVISLVTFLAAVFFLATRGLNFGVDFRGGTVIEVNYAQAVDFTRVRSAIDKLDVGEYSAQSFGGANTALYAPTNGAANIDVYPFIVCGDEATFDIALKGEDSFDMNVIPHTQTDKNDILGQRGYCGASFWSASLVVNNGFMAVVEAGVSSLA